MIWLKFFLGQFVMLLAMIIGLLLLPVPCLLRAWRDSADSSIKDKRKIDEWKWSWLNYIYGNPEDGVSGKYALVWAGGNLVPYLPTAPDWWRAFRWSALRNSVDNLKYVFSRPLDNGKDGPIIYWWKFKFGYQLENGFNVPVIGLK